MFYIRNAQKSWRRKKKKIAGKTGAEETRPNQGGVVQEALETRLCDTVVSHF